MIVMKMVSLLVSIGVFGFAAYTFATDFQNSLDFNHLIYMCLLVILMSICIVGIMINIPIIIKKKRYFSLILFSRKITKKSKKSAQIANLKKQDFEPIQSEGVNTIA